MSLAKVYLPKALVSR